jgi:outer membrane protein TolC
MKNSILFLLFSSMALVAQSQPLSWAQLWQAAQQNRASLQAGKADLLAAQWAEKTAQSAYLPQISLAYDYRYNPLIPAQAVPVGQFLPVPTDETRIIRFGTNWQQSAGLSFYQPLIDRDLRSRLAQSRLQQQQAQLRFEEAEALLAEELLLTALRVGSAKQSLQAALSDTQQSFNSWQLAQERVQAGRLSTQGYEQQQIEHLQSLRTWRNSAAQLLREQIYLSFLAGLPLERVLADDSYLADLPLLLQEKAASIQPDFSRLRLQSESRARELELQRLKQSRLPRLGIDAFLGANQFTNSFQPAASGTWFGASYVGLSLRMPLLQASNGQAAQRNAERQNQAAVWREKEDEARQLRDVVRAEVEMLQQKELLGYETQLLQLQQQAFQRTQTQFEAGRSSAENLRQAKESLVQQEAATRRQELLLFESQVKLLQAQGLLLDRVKGGKG